MTTPTQLDLANGSTLLLEPLQRKGNRLQIDGFDPCVVCLITIFGWGARYSANLEQSVLPPLVAGWTTRSKSHHFAAYDRVAAEFANLINIDPWLINPYFGTCGKVDFQQRNGEEMSGSASRQYFAKNSFENMQNMALKTAIRDCQSRRRNLWHGIMTVKDASEVKQLNRKQRNKMAVGKGWLQVPMFWYKKGVYTFEHIYDAVAEPVRLYDGSLCRRGGFYRSPTVSGRR